MSGCISLLGRPEHRTTDRGPYTAEMYFFTFLEARSLGSHAGWADHVCPTLASSGPDRVLGDSGKEAYQCGCRCQRAARLPWRQLPVLQLFVRCGPSTLCQQQLRRALPAVEGFLGCQGSWNQW